jgi:hypothetical protein
MSNFLNPYKALLVSLLSLTLIGCGDTAQNDLQSSSEANDQETSVGAGDNDESNLDSTIDDSNRSGTDSVLSFVLPNEYEREALGIIQNKCASCHNQSTGYGGINYIDDLESLLSNGLINLDAPSTSPLLVQIMSDRMPAAGSPLSDNEKQIVTSWIELWADPKTVEFNSSEHQPFDPSYSSLQHAITINTAFNLTPQSSVSAGTAFYISPSLPLGLELDKDTGVISGTPTTLQAQKTYLLTTVKSEGVMQIDMTFTVVDVPPSSITYSSSTLDLTVGFESISLDPTVSGGGQVTGFSISKPLPEGLEFDSKTGAISGQATKESTESTYQIHAFNSGGFSTPFEITIEVSPAPDILAQYNAEIEPVYGKINWDNSTNATLYYLDQSSYGSEWGNLSFAVNRATTNVEPLLSSDTYPVDLQIDVDVMQKYVADQSGYLLHYVDSNNYYKIELARDVFKVYRVHAGTQVEIGSNTDFHTIHNEHTYHFQVITKVVNGNLQFDFYRSALHQRTDDTIQDQDRTWQLTDSDQTKIATFLGGGQFGIFQPKASEFKITYFDNLVIKDPN